MKLCSNCLKPKSHLLRFTFFVLNELKVFFLCDECRKDEKVLNILKNTYYSPERRIPLEFDLFSITKKEKDIKSISYSIPKQKCAWCIEPIPDGQGYVEFRLCTNCLNKKDIIEMCTLLWKKQKEGEKHSNN